MNDSHSQLWHRLEELDLDGDAKLSFTRRLARDNGWNYEFAERVVGEYKRFLFLAATAGHPVTPSDEVDQAWHLHLVYTRSYWDELCGEILGFPLHHGPTKGGASEGAKFVDWYAKTLESYRLAFAEETPRDIWPPASVRFGEAPHYRRVNATRVWMIRKPRWAARVRRQKWASIKPAMLVTRFAPVVLLLLIAGCEAPTNLHVSQWSGAEFLGAFWTACAVGLALAWFLRSREQPPLDAVFPIHPLDAYEVARLKDGGNLAIDVALATLHERGAIEVTDRGSVRATGLNTPRNPFELAVYRRIGGENTVLAVRAGALNDTLTRPLHVIDQKLRDAGLLLSPESQKNANKVPLGILFTLIAIGVIRIFVGIERDRPVGFLVLTCVGLVVAAIWFATHSPRRSKRGNLLLQRLHEQYNTAIPSAQSFRVTPPYRPAPPVGADIETAALFFALAGPVAFPMEIRRAVAPPSTNGDGGSGCSSGSSDGGGDGGGSGCGGCGGCGGGGGD